MCWTKFEAPSQDAVKEAGHFGVEKYMSEIFDNWASFRPQYMIGSGNNKDCEEWFFDRKCRIDAKVLEIILFSGCLKPTVLVTFMKSRLMQTRL